MRADVSSCISLLIRSSRIWLARVNVHILFTESSKAFRSKSMRRSVSTVNWHATSAHRFPRIRGWKRRLVARRANFLAAIDWFKCGQWPYGSAVFLLTSVHRVVFEKNRYGSVCHSNYLNIGPCSCCALLWIVKDSTRRPVRLYNNVRSLRQSF